MKPQQFRIIFLTLGLLVACTTRAPISAAIGKKLQSTATIDVAELAPFQWEKMYVFSPYTPRSEICGTLVSFWRACKSVVPESIDEGSYLLVFAAHGAVVHHELFTRRHADFCDRSCVLTVSRDRAKFDVRVSVEPNNAPRYRLVLRAA